MGVAAHHRAGGQLQLLGTQRGARRWMPPADQPAFGQLGVSGAAGCGAAGRVAEDVGAANDVDVAVLTASEPLLHGMRWLC